MAGKLWSGRLPGRLDPGFEAFSCSLPADLHLFEHDLKASMAHVRALGRAELISATDAQALEGALQDLLQAGVDAFPWTDQDEDLHTAIERVVVERVGEAGLRLHTGRSRNDQVATASHLYAHQAGQELAGEALEFAQAALTQAQAAGDQIIVGMTHLQPAQPVLLAHHLLAYAWMASRDAERFLTTAARSRHSSPLGAGALAGTGFDLDVGQCALEMGFAAPYDNSIDAVSDRDYLAELTFACALATSHLSRLAEELILWSHPAFGRVRLADQFVTGSSMMPQKRNPDSAELVRAKSSSVIGDLVGVLSLLKGLPLAYMRDLQEDKPPLYHAVETTKDSLLIMTGALQTATFMPAAPAYGDLSLATELADHLVRSGMPFRQAHAIVGQLSATAEELGGNFSRLTRAEFRQASSLFGDHLEVVLDPKQAIALHHSVGGSAPKAVRAQMERLESVLQGLRQSLVS
ncbi:MAG: argininosuccinate lyase [Sulfobacillus sp.]